MQTQIIIGERLGAGYGQIDAGEVNDEQAKELGEAVRRHLVPVSPNAPSCCIDGRYCVHTKSGMPTEPRPSVAGGATTTAYAAAELTAYFGNNDFTPTERALRIDQMLNDAGLPTGNHIDQAGLASAFAGNKTGCGANDRLPENLARIDSDDETVDAVTAMILGNAYQPAIMSGLARKTAAHRNVGWNPAYMTNVIDQRDPNALEVLASDDTPTKGHKEALVVINTIENTTVDRDALVAETGQQVFVIDLWYIDKLARTLAAGSETSEQYVTLRHAMVAYQVGTYLTLCNGTQRPAVISEVQPLAA